MGSSPHIAARARASNPEDCGKLAGDNIPGQWVPDSNSPRQGRWKSPQISFVIFHASRLQQFHILFLKRFLPMMLFLVGDVPGMLSPANFRQPFGLMMGASTVKE